MSPLNPLSVSPRLPTSPARVVANAALVVRFANSVSDDGPHASLQSSRERPSAVTILPVTVTHIEPHFCRSFKERPKNAPGNVRLHSLAGRYGSNPPAKFENHVAFIPTDLELAETLSSPQCNKSHAICVRLRNMKRRKEIQSGFYLDIRVDVQTVVVAPHP